MQVAQRLYEGVAIGGENTGLITYMRTDGVQMAEEAYAAARTAIGRNYGKEYLPDGPRRYTSKAKNAQEAHEAVRPTDFDRKPGQVSMEPDMARLYELIWKRAVASQMEAALDRAHHRRNPVHRRQGDAARHRPGHQVRRLPDAVSGRQGRERRRGWRPPAASSTRATRRSWSTPFTRSTSPNRRRATRKPRWSSASKNSASAARPPTPRRCRR